MNEAFWLMWKLATPILAVVALLLIVERRNLRQRISILEADVEDAQRKRRVLHTQVVALNSEAITLRDQSIAAQATVQGLIQRSKQGCPCEELEATKARLTYITGQYENPGTAHPGCQQPKVY